MDSFPTNLSPENESNRRLRCAFILAENPQVHRTANATSSATVRSSGAEVEAPTRYVTMAHAYSGTNNTQWVCRMWRRMKASVGPELSEFGYYHGPFSSDPPRAVRKRAMAEKEALPPRGRSARGYRTYHYYYNLYQQYFCTFATYLTRTKSSHAHIFYSQRLASLLSAGS
jgi:hypothetical protein